MRPGHPGEMLSVAETFVSIQGEGTWVGWPCFFIRLSGCNLRCSYCDTEYAYHGGENLSLRELTDRWRQAGVRLAQVTGGEPLLQSGAVSLMEGLLTAGAHVLLETNGSLSLRRVPPGVIKVVDRKTPGSGMAESWLSKNLRWVGARDQVKFVITGRDDYEWARQEVLRLRLASYTQVLFSPAWGAVAQNLLADWVLEDRLPVRFQVQLHKLLWTETRGR